jgi:hypothetical protein
MDKEPRQWNEELVRLCFNTTIADRILNIPLCRNRVHDCISWPYTHTGIYIVKSAYILAKSEAVHLKASAKGKGEISDQGCTTIGWKRLWGIKAPPKMRIILWRFVHDCLPTGQQLRIRNISVDDQCCHCGRDETLDILS